MDSEDTKRQKRVFSLLALRFCTVIVFSVVCFFVLSFILGVLVIILGELWVSSSTSSASLASRCKILSSSVDLRSSKVCGIGLLNNKAQHVFHPFERDKFRCRYDYYWASVFKVEYKDHLMGQTRLAFSEAPNEALPPECRPNFGAALLTKDNFKVNETYDCWYAIGIPKIKLYQDGFFGCQANDLSFTDNFKQYAVLLSKLLQSWFSGKGRPKYWRYDVIAGIVSGFSTDAPRIIDPGQDDATMAEPDDSSTKDKPGWINGEDTDLKPADETEDELEPAEESMLELKPAEVIVDELDELSELSDTSLELNELSDTEDGAGLVAGRNEHFSAQRKIHNKFNLGRFYTKFDQTFPQSISSPFSSRMPRGSQQGSLGRAWEK